MTLDFIRWILFIIDLFLYSLCSYRFAVIIFRGSFYSWNKSLRSMFTHVMWMYTITHEAWWVLCWVGWLDCFTAYIVFVYKQLNAKTLLFQTIQFSVSTQSNSFSSNLSEQKRLLDGTWLFFNMWQTLSYMIPVERNALAHRAWLSLVQALFKKYLVKKWYRKNTGCFGLFV